MLRCFVELQYSDKEVRYECGYFRKLVLRIFAKMSLRAALLGVAFSLVTESLATSNASGSNGTTSGDRPVISDGTIESMKDWLTQVNDQRSCRVRTTHDT